MMRFRNEIKFYENLKNALTKLGYDINPQKPIIDQQFLPKIHSELWYTYNKVLGL